jgi:hypothetical protein
MFYRRMLSTEPQSSIGGIDEETLATWEAVSPYTMTSRERIVAVCDAVRYLSRYKILGDIVECGVWRGGSVLAILRTLIQTGDVNRDIHLYDTYEGMSEPSQIDRAYDGRSASDLLQKELKNSDSVIWAYASLESVKATVAQAGYPENRLHFIQGKVEETLRLTVPDRIALLRLDTDWYESTKAELNYLFPKLQSGGVIIIDDYGHWEGAQHAVDEYIAENNVQILLHRTDYTGRMAVKQ